MQQQQHHQHAQQQQQQAQQQHHHQGPNMSMNPQIKCEPLSPPKDKTLGAPMMNQPRSSPGPAVNSSPPYADEELRVRTMEKDLPPNKRPRMTETWVS